MKVLFVTRLTILSLALLCANRSVCISDPIDALAEYTSNANIQVRLDPPAYHLVVGSYGTFETAKSFVDALAQRGYKSYIIFPEPGGTTYRIGLFNAKDRQAVENFSKQLQGKLKGWIYLEDIPSEWPSKAQGVIEEQTIGVATPVTEGTMYYLILGSFSSYETAEELANRLRENKYEPEILLPTLDAPTYRVHVYATQNKSEIEAYANKLERTGRETGWIYEQPADLVAFGRGISDGQSRVTQTSVLRAKFDYYLIAASFKDLASARVFADEKLAEGFFPLIIAPDDPSGNYRVSVYHANDRSELEYFSDQNNPRTKENLWIYSPGM